MPPNSFRQIFTIRRPTDARHLNPTRIGTNKRAPVVSVLNYPRPPFAGVVPLLPAQTVLIEALQSDRVRLGPARYAEPWGYGLSGRLWPLRGLSGTPLIFGGVVADRIGNFYAGVILYFLGSVMRRSESWRDWLVLKFSTRRRSLPYTSSEKRSALATSWGSMSVPARILITENASLRTTWHRADALVSHGKGFRKSVYERSRKDKECFEGPQS